MNFDIVAAPGAEMRRFASVFLHVGALDADAAVLYISVATVWELAVKASAGRLTLPKSVENYIDEKLSELLRLSLRQEHRQKKFRIVLLHHPLYTSGRYGVHARLMRWRLEHLFIALLHPNDAPLARAIQEKGYSSAYVIDAIRRRTRRTISVRTSRMNAPTTAGTRIV